MRQPPRLPGAEEGAEYYDPATSATPYGGADDSEPPPPAYATATQAPAAAPAPAAYPAATGTGSAATAPDLEAALPVEVDPAAFPNLRRQQPRGGGFMDVL